MKIEDGNIESRTRLGNKGKCYMTGSITSLEVRNMDENGSVPWGTEIVKVSCFMLKSLNLLRTGVRGITESLISFFLKFLHRKWAAHIHNKT